MIFLISSLYCCPPATPPAPQTTLQVSPVTTALTPGSAAAFDVSTFRIRACACGLRSTRAYTMPGSWMSPVYNAFPVARSIESILGVAWPTTFNAETAELAEEIF